MQSHVILLWEINYVLSHRKILEQFSEWIQQKFRLSLGNISSSSGEQSHYNCNYLKKAAGLWLHVAFTINVYYDSRLG